MNSILGNSSNKSKASSDMGQMKEEVPMYYKSITEALALVKKAVEGEKKDRMEYNFLISMAPTQEEKDIITSIRNDEMKHFKMFREIYKYFTGQDIEAPQNVTAEKPASYIDGIKEALMGELSAMERYRIIRAGMPNEYYRDMVFEILTDEMKHATKYNYILTLENEDYMDEISNDITNEQEELTPDEWINYTMPLVGHAMDDVKAGINSKHILQEFVLMGVLVGMGYDPEEAFLEVENWEKTGMSKSLMQSKMGK